MKIEKRPIFRQVSQIAIRIGFLTGMLLFMVGCVETTPIPTIAYDPSVLDVCKEIFVDFDLEAELPADARIAVGTAGTGDVHEWQFALPDSRIPETAAEVDVIICVDNGEEILDKCDYTGSTGGISKEIVQYNPVILIVEKGAELAFTADVFEGEPPEFTECPWSYKSHYDFEGDLPTADFLTWVEENIP